MSEQLLFNDLFSQKSLRETNIIVIFDDQFVAMI